MAGQHKASLEKVLQSALAHRAAGSRLAETVASIEAMVLSGILGSAQDSKNEDSIRRTRSAIAHREYGKRLQDAWETLLDIIDAESLSLSADEIDLPGQHAQSLRKTLVSAMSSKKMGDQYADMCSLQDKALDALIAAYPPGPAKTALLAIKNT
jgi:hypothetical protein